jgi:hypothetical protein
MGNIPSPPQHAGEQSKSADSISHDEENGTDKLHIGFKVMGNDKMTNRHATLEVKKMETQAVAWTREFPRETPACWNCLGRPDGARMGYEQRRRRFRD